MKIKNLKNYILPLLLFYFAVNSLLALILDFSSFIEYFSSPSSDSSYSKFFVMLTVPLFIFAFITYVYAWRFKKLTPPLIKLFTAIIVLQFLPILIAILAFPLGGFAAIAVADVSMTLALALSLILYLAVLITMKDRRIFLINVALAFAFVVFIYFNLINSAEDCQKYYTGSDLTKCYIEQGKRI